MAEPNIALSRLAGTPGDGDLLVVGPSLGTSVEALWGAAAQCLGDRFEVVGWDLPGHGRSGAATDGFTIAELASTVRGLATAVLGLQPGRGAWYAGVSMGGAVAFELAVEPGRFRGVAAIAAAPRFGEPDAWQERAALVRRAGTPVMVSGSAQRWFAPDFPERDPSTASRLLLSLSDSDRESYALCCDALAAYDAGPRLTGTVVPVLVAPGEHDEVVPPLLADELTHAIPDRRMTTVLGAGHLPPAEQPASVAALLEASFVHEEAHS